MVSGNGNGRVRITPLDGVGLVGKNCWTVQYKDTLVGADFGLDPSAFFQRKDDKLIVVPPARMDILDKYLKEREDAALSDIRRDGGSDFNEMADQEEVYRQARESIYWFITHPHFDHDGAIAELLSRGISDDHLFMSSWTSRYLYRKQENIGLRLGERAPWTIVRERDRSRENSSMKLGDIQCYIIPTNHSVFGSFAISFFAGGKKIVYLSDFKFYGFTRNIPDPKNPGSVRDGKLWFEDILSRIRGATGVDCLILDVLNSDLEGFTPPEEEVLRNLERLVSEAPGQVFISMISSNLQRLEETIKMLKRNDKTFALLGSSMRESYDMLQERFYNFVNPSPAGVGFNPTAKAIWQDQELQKELNKALGRTFDYDEADVILCAGTQGEENSGLRQVLEGKPYDHGMKTLRFRNNTWLIGASRIIPGNEEYWAEEIREIAKRCDRVFLHEGEMKKLGLVPGGNISERFVHVSGHGQLGDLGRTLEILQPKLVIPCHAPDDRVAMFEAKFGGQYNIRRLAVGETLEI